MGMKTEMMTCREMLEIEINADKLRQLYCLSLPYLDMRIPDWVGGNRSLVYD